MKQYNDVAFIYNYDPHMFCLMCIDDVFHWAGVLLGWPVSDCLSTMHALSILRSHLPSLLVPSLPPSLPLISYSQDMALGETADRRPEQPL